MHRILPTLSGASQGYRICLLSSPLPHAKSRVGRRGMADTQLRVDWGLRNPLAARKAECQVVKCQGWKVRWWFLGTGTGTQGSPGGPSGGNGGRAEGSETRGLWKKTFGGRGFPFSKDKRSPQPPDSWSGGPGWLNHQGVGRKPSSHVGSGLPSPSCPSPGWFHRAGWLPQFPGLPALLISPH